MAKLTIVRGLPGSGKSTLAKSMGVEHVEADMYHIEDGIYKFDPSKIKDSHQWCFDCVCSFLSIGQNTVVSNTFTQKWEMQRYIDYCEKNNHEYEIIVCRGEFQNIHGVPTDVLESMKKRWEE